MPNVIGSGVRGSGVPQAQGNTVWAAHIEQPQQRFAVEFDSAGHFNVIRFADTHRRIFILAETPAGALAIARYHCGRRGSNFVFVGPA